MESELSSLSHDHNLSKDVARSASEVLSATAAETLHLARPLVVKSGKGSRVIDVDDHEYLDYVMGFGPLFLGHAPDVVVEAVEQTARTGLHYALPHDKQEPLARLIVEEVPCAERIVFCNSGTEATMYAIRACRAITGRTRVAMFEGGYHGAHDYVLANVASGSPVDAPRLEARKGGVTAEALSTMHLLPYWNRAAFDQIREMAGDLAAVIVEPVQGGNPQSGQGEWLRELAEVCRQSGVLLIFDEIITGFRLGMGGGQSWFDVVPDMATYGKIIGGGLPVGAVVGRGDLMESFVAHYGHGYPISSEAFCTGTFNGNPMSMSAGFATLNHLRENPGIFDEVNARSDELARRVNEFCSSVDVPVRINNCGSVLLMHFGRLSPVKTARDIAQAQAEVGPSGQPLSAAAERFFAVLLERGVIMPGVHHFHLSTAHTDSDIEFTVEAITRSLSEVRDLGLC